MSKSLSEFAHTPVDRTGAVSEVRKAVNTPYFVGRGGADVAMLTLVGDASSVAEAFKRAAAAVEAYQAEAGSFKPCPGCPD